MKRPSGLTLVTVVLLVLLPALAVLQYRWVGQVSAAERDRMARNLRAAAFQFRQAFDSELGRTNLLAVGPATIRDGSSERYNDRYDLFLNTTQHPRIVSHIYLVDGEGGHLGLRVWDTDARVFNRVEWPAILAQYRDQFDQQRREYDSPRRAQPNIVDDALMIFPIRSNDRTPGQGPGPRPPQIEGAQPRPPFGFTIVELNLDYVTHEMLPELAQRLFEQSEGDVYRVAVTTVRSPARVLYRSGADAPTDPARADVRESLYGFDRLGFLRRGATDDRPLNIVVNVIEGQNGSSVQGDNGRWRLLVQHQSG